MPQKTCTCGKTFHAARANALYCSDRCRKRTKRSGADVVSIAPADAPAPKAPPKVGPIETAARIELEAVDRLNTSAGLTAVALARRLDHGFMETGSAYSSLAARFEAQMKAATRGAGAATAPQQLRDELAARRAQHA